MVIKREQLMVYVNVFLWVFLNGSVVMLRYGNIFIPCVFAIFGFQIILKKKFHELRENIVLVFAFSMIYLINYMFYMDQCWNELQYFVNLLLLFCSFLFMQLITLERFMLVYKNVMVIVATGSLLMHFGGMVAGLNYYTIPNIQGTMRMVGLHNYWGYIVGRNSGIFLGARRLPNVFEFGIVL